MLLVMVELDLHYAMNSSGHDLINLAVRLTVIDTPGFGDYVNNRDSWQPIIEFLDDQHESYMLQEQQPRRSDKIDMRVHACLYFIRPTGHTLKPLDIEVMKRLSTRVNLIPVIAKADTLSPSDLAKFKARVSWSPIFIFILFLDVCAIGQGCSQLT